MPSEAEVSVLLRKVSKKAKESGLKFNYMKKQDTVPQEFYVELPNKLEVLGNYDDLGLFVSSLSTLDRIVTVQDVTIKVLETQGNKDNKDNKDDNRLEMKAIIVTYNEVPAEEDDALSAKEAISE
jgi:type IV pilus assembly protein PilO